MVSVSWLAAPLWPLQILSTRKNFSGNRLLGSERLNRRGLHVWRSRLAHRMAWHRRARLAHLVDPADRAFFGENGYVEKRDFLPAADFERLVTEVMALAVPAREMQEGDAVTRRIPVTPKLLKRMPALRKLIRTPAWRGLTRYVASVDIDPNIFIQTIFSQADACQTDPQTSLHVDTFHPCMKAWFFLEDVPLETGPFSYVPGSHLPTRRRLAWQKRKSILASRPGGPKGGAFRLDESELRAMRLPPPKRFAVPGNTLVVGDTSGMHARTPSRGPTARVEIWAECRPNPFVPFSRSPTALIPGYEDRKTALLVNVRDRLARVGLKYSNWHNVGVVSPRTPPVLPRLPNGGHS